MSLADCCKICLTIPLSFTMSQILCSKFFRFLTRNTVSDDLFGTLALPAPTQSEDPWPETDPDPIYQNIPAQKTGNSQPWPTPEPANQVDVGNNESDPWGSDPFQPTQKAIANSPWPEPETVLPVANENTDPWATTYDPFSSQSGGGATYDEVPWDNDPFAGQTFDSVPAEQQVYDDVPDRDRHRACFFWVLRPKPKTPGFDWVLDRKF